MKLCLTLCVLSLVPLVFADPPTRVVAKFLYRNDHVIGQSFDDAKELGYYYDGRVLIFHTQSNSSKKVEFMTFNPSYWEKQYGGFALETYPYEKDEKPNSDFCHEESNDKEIKKIRACYGKIVLRAMTEEEGKQMGKFEYDRGSNNIKVVYNRGQISTKSKGFRHFLVQQYQENEDKRKFIVSTDQISKYRRFMRLNGVLVDKAFVIENLSAGKTNCRETDVTDLKLDACAGDIQLRTLNRDEN